MAWSYCRRTTHETRKWAIAEALQSLYDEQYGPPLLRFEESWTKAMKMAELALGITHATGHEVTMARRLLMVEPTVSSLSELPPLLLRLPEEPAAMALRKLLFEPCPQMMGNDHHPGQHKECHHKEWYLEDCECPCPFCAKSVEWACCHGTGYIPAAWTEAAPDGALYGASMPVLLGIGYNLGLWPARVNAEPWRYRVTFLAAEESEEPDVGGDDWYYRMDSATIAALIAWAKWRLGE